MLKAVKTKPQYKGAITEAVNYSLEAALIGIPIWCLRHGHEDAARSTMAIIARLPRDLFVRSAHKIIRDCYVALSTAGLPPSDAWMEQEARKRGHWSDDEAAKGVMTLGFLAELEEAGNCRHTLKIEGDLSLIHISEPTRPY